MRASLAAPPPGSSPRAGFQATRPRPEAGGWCCCGSHAEQVTAPLPPPPLPPPPAAPGPGPAPTVTFCRTFRAFRLRSVAQRGPGLGAALALESVTESGGPAGSCCRARPGEEPPSSCPAHRGTAPTQHTRKTTLRRLGTRQHAAWPLGAFGQGLPPLGPGTAWGRGQALGQPPVARVKRGRFHTLHPSSAL